MDKNTKPDHISGNTIMFAQSVIQSVMDMTGKNLELDKSSFEKQPFFSKFKMLSYIRFTGIVQGGYILCMDEKTALKLIDAYEDGMTEADIKKMREEFGGFARELLNIAVGQVIVELEKNFDGLTYNSPIIVYGEIELPAVSSGNICLQGEEGEIQCGFTLDLSELKIGRKYEKSLQELEVQKRKAGKYKKDIEKIMQLIPCCLLAIDMNGKILPGFSLSAPSFAGYTPDKDIIEMELSDFLKLDASAARTIKEFFQIFKKNGIFSIDVLYKMCEGVFSSLESRQYQLEWLPVSDSKTGNVEKLMVIVKDITTKEL